MAHLYGPVSGHHFLAWLDTNEGLVAIDTGWDVAKGEPYEGSDLEAITLASEATGKPVGHILLTHNHWDHRLNLPLLLERWPDARVYAHANGGVAGVTDPLAGGERLEFGGEPVEVVPSPGHSADRDELSFFLPAHRFLFCGDVAQPQGPSYSFSNGLSPVPFFHYGDEYRRTLERLIALEPLRGRTGHGDFLGQEQLRQWLRVTLAAVTRIEELALELVGRYPQKDNDWLAESIYDHVADERRFGLRAANQRKRQFTYEAGSDYELFDKPGILWAIGQARDIV